MSRSAQSTPAHDLLRDKVLAAGVVGMGGGGFPTHLKLRPELKSVIINGAECEPLLAADYQLIRNRGEAMLAGAAAVARAGGAAEIVLALKRKNRHLADPFRDRPPEFPFRTVLMEDVYPSGDEFFVVRDAAGHTLPQGSIPVAAGYFVSNAATFAAIADALEGRPLGRRFVTVCGAVARPLTVETPIGVPFETLIELAGGPTAEPWRILEGGVMMGQLAEPDTPVTKTTSGIVVLPAGHPAVLERTRPLHHSVKIAESICCQCVKCTELCSRYQLGHDIEPHKVMRLVGSSRDYSQLGSQTLFHCSGCGLCSLVACPFDLSPRRLILEARKQVSRIKGPPPAVRTRVEPDLFSVSSHRLVQHLLLDSYEHSKRLDPFTVLPARLRLPLKQHAGRPAEPVVAPGQRVRAGQLIARLPADGFGANLHAPLDGRVTAVGAAIDLDTAAAGPHAKGGNG